MWEEGPERWLGYHCGASAGEEVTYGPYLFSHGSWGRPRSGVRFRGVTRGPCARGSDLQKRPWSASNRGDSWAVPRGYTLCCRAPETVSG